MMPGEILKYSIEVAVATPSQAVRVTPGRRVTVHSGPDSEVGHWQPRKRHREDLCLEDLLLLGRRRYGTTSRLSFRGLVQSTGDISHGL